jgi:cyanophycinase
MRKALGFFKNVAIDQHVLVRNSQFDILKNRPEFLGIHLTD